MMRVCVMVVTVDGPVFVTGYGDHFCRAYWDTDKVPITFSVRNAERIVNGLADNGMKAFMVSADEMPSRLRMGGYLNGRIAGNASCILFPKKAGRVITIPC